MRIHVIGVLLFAIAAVLPADTLLMVSDVRKLVDQTMDQIRGGDCQAGMYTLGKVSTLSQEKLDATLSSIKSQLAYIDSQYGNIVGIEFIDQVQIGNSLIRIRQLEKRNSYAMALSFWFYNNGFGWVLTNMDWNDKLKDLFP